MRQITDETIGPKTRQRMIDNRAKWLYDHNAELPADVAMDLSIDMQTAYEMYIKQDENMEAAGNTFDLLRQIALSYTPRPADYQREEHTHTFTCPC